MRNDYLRTAFEMFDRDGSGSIDKTELLAILGGEGMENMMPKEELMAYIQEVDNDGDGEIDFDEF